MFKLIDAKKYSMNSGSSMAWEVTYSDGKSEFKNRCVKNPGQISQVQHKTCGGEWYNRKSYTAVSHNKKRYDYRIIREVENYLAA